MSGVVKNSKLQKISSYDPGGIYTNGQLFGLPFTNQESEVVIVPMPWEVTTSYRDGTAQGPRTVLKASYQVDLYDLDAPEAWELGIGIQPISSAWSRQNTVLRRQAKKYLDYLYNGGDTRVKWVRQTLAEINQAGAELNGWMKKETAKLLKQNKLVGVLGGEHSVSLGFMQALAEQYPRYSILHLDAHADYRAAYEGFEFSHASIQYNAGKIKQVDRQVLVGIRDYSHAEAQRIAESHGRIAAFPDREIKRGAYAGKTWQAQCGEIIKPLSKEVYISFDIDILDPSLCPHTGTPVPGGLEFEQVFYLIEAVIKSGRKIIGFDLCEVAPGVGNNGEWDAIVGARVLYRLAILMAKSQRRI
ncbi:MAG: agmatinase family protein [Candidatus Magasanikbacteria bacterium]|nr:agmatinase family protein [Candidatus Magasanikbacteria bacterium]